MDDLDFVDPTSLQPSFIAQQVICAYPISDLYASSPRYLYYALLALCFVTHWTGWLANVFLGAAATYAGTAAIQAFILRASNPKYPDVENVTIPFVSLPVASNLTGLQALVTNTSTVSLQPKVLELDIDAVLAITVTGYLVLLPMQCWSRVVKANRARHVLITIWNVMMLVGAVVALVEWPQTLEVPEQYRFCYPSYPDPSSATNDGGNSDLLQSDWNTTVWSLFSNLTAFGLLSDNCLYPCFNTTQILRKQTSISATLYSESTTPRINFDDLQNRSVWVTVLPTLMYFAFGITAAATLYLTIISWLKGITRIPVGDPRLLWSRRKKIWIDLWSDAKFGMRQVWCMVREPKHTYKTLRARSARRLTVDALHFCRFWIDILTLVVLVVAMILSPISIIGFLVWIEWYIRHDGQNGETPRQVGQWTSSVAIGLILISAAILQLKYRIASAEEIKSEIHETQEHLQRLEILLETKEGIDKQRKHSV